MNTKLSQEGRTGTLKTDLGADKLVLVSLDGEEAVNAQFRYRIEALSMRDDINFDALLGTHATVSIQSFDQPEVHFDGIISEVRALGAAPEGWRYQITLRPWTWLMSLRRKQQIYHEKSVVQIVEEVFGPYAEAFEVKLSKSYPKLEYTVQYRESDLDFVSRMLERFGISYHFTHIKGEHKLILTDGVMNHDDVPGEARPFIGVKDGHRAEEEHFWAVRPATRITTGAIRLTDYNFKFPQAKMEVERMGDAKHASGTLESYDYPGLYLDEKEGTDVARLGLDKERGQAGRIEAEGDAASLRAGHKVKVSGEKVHGVKSTVCLSARHHFRSSTYGASASGDASTFEGRWLLMPIDLPLAPEKVTPLAVVQGPQTAVVVGEGEIDCDDFGRIKVQFHWDLDKRYSMRCRVSQNWAGKGWGGMVIPRIGMEVVVEFLEGDPDKPLVTGCVYNGKNDTPYELPKHKTRSTFMTDTHKGTGFNELRFEDEKDEEEIFIHAQKDMNTKIEHNSSERVNKNKVENVGHNKASEIENNLFQVVDGDMELRVGPSNRGAYSPNGAKEETQGIRSVPPMLGDPGSREGTGNLSVSVQKTKAQVIGEDHNETVEGFKDTEIYKDYTVRGRKKIKIEAGDEIELVCGNSQIKMLANGTIEINGKKILEKGTSLVSVKSSKIELN